MGVECKSESDRVAVATIGDVLADAMNMMQGADGQGDSFDIAEISGVEYDDNTLATDPYGFAASQELTMTWVDGRAIVSAPRWDRALWDQRLTLAQAALAIFVCTPDTRPSKFRWLFSGKEVERADADETLSSWQEERAPPVMSIIEFLVEDRGGQRYIRTIGLSVFVNYEVEAMIEEDHAELARMVGRLAQEILHSGPVERDSITGPDAGKYSLKHFPKTGNDGPSIRISTENT